MCLIPFDLTERLTHGLRPARVSRLTMEGTFVTTILGTIRPIVIAQRRSAVPVLIPIGVGREGLSTNWAGHLN